MGLDPPTPTDPTRTSRVGRLTVLNREAQYAMPSADQGFAGAAAAGTVWLSRESLLQRRTSKKLT